MAVERAEGGLENDPKLEEYSPFGLVPLNLIIHNFKSEEATGNKISSLKSENDAIYLSRGNFYDVQDIFHSEGIEEPIKNRSKRLNSFYNIKQRKNSLIYADQLVEHVESSDLLRKLSSQTTYAVTTDFSTAISNNEATLTKVPKFESNSNFLYLSHRKFISMRSLSHVSDKRVDFKYKLLGNFPTLVKNKSFNLLKKIRKPSYRNRSETKTSYEEHLLDEIYEDDEDKMRYKTGRLLMSWQRSYPIITSSVIRYRKTPRATLASRQLLKLKNVLTNRDKSDLHVLGQVKDTNFSHFFDENLLNEELKVLFLNDENYDPFQLDCKDVNIGKHRVVKTLEGYSFSIISYKRKRDLKEEINSVFRDRFPKIPTTLTLSKIRSIKKKLTRIVINLGIQLSTLAICFVYLEKLVLRQLVDKYNRKLITSVCLILAFKFNETRPEILPKIREELDKVFKTGKKAIFKNEFRVLSLLYFNLLVPKRQWKPHLENIIEKVEPSSTMNCAMSVSSSSSEEN